MAFTDDIGEVLNRVIGSHVKGVKLGPGIVGRNSSIAWALEFVMLAGVISGAVLHSVWLAGISVCGAILSALLITYMNVQFGRQNPAAALMEGAHFLQYQQLQAVAVRGAHTAELPPAPAILPPSELPSPETKQLEGNAESNS